jgi:hypothetical protein
MPRSNRPPRRGVLFDPETKTVPARPARTWWVVAAIILLLVAVQILLFNQQHSGDRLKIRRELRKF